MIRVDISWLGLVLSTCVACSSDVQQKPAASATGGALSQSGAGAGGSPLTSTGGANGGTTVTTSGGTSAGESATGGAGGNAGGMSAGGASAGAGGSGGAAGGNAGTAGAGGGAMLTPCSDPAVSRLKVWEMQVVGGTQVPANGSPLRQYDGGGYELYVEWTLTGGGAYGTANAPINNMGQYSNGADPAKNGIDISKGTGLTIEYASTGNTYMQIRTGAVPHGGDHFKADLPSTNGMLKTILLDYASFRRPGGNTPPGDDVLKDAFSFTFVGSGTTKLTLRQISIPGFIPPCN
jgi:hypothetical protein